MVKRPWFLSITGSDCAYNSGSFGDDLTNEFKPPVKHVDLPRSNGS